MDTKLVVIQVQSKHMLPRNSPFAGEAILYATMHCGRTLQLIYTLRLTVRYPLLSITTNNSKKNPAAEDVPIVKAVSATTLLL
jgi:hypothetical protein